MLYPNQIHNNNLLHKGLKKNYSVLGFNKITECVRVIMSQVLLGTEADQVDFLCGRALSGHVNLQLVAKASPDFHNKGTIIWKSIRFNLGVYLRPKMKGCILYL